MRVTLEPMGAGFGGEPLEPGYTKTVLDRLQHARCPFLSSE